MSGLFHLLFVVIHMGIFLLVENEVMGLSYDPHSGFLWISLAMHYATSKLLKGRIPKHEQEDGRTLKRKKEENQDQEAAVKMAKMKDAINDNDDAQWFCFDSHQPLDFFQWENLVST